MVILPAIDIKNATCVRLSKGEIDTAEKVANSPIETANEFKKYYSAFMFGPLIFRIISLRWNNKKDFGREICKKIHCWI